LVYGRQQRHIPLAVGDFRFGQVQAQHAIERAVRCRQPVALQGLGRCLVLYVKGQSAIVVELEVRQHARVDQVAIERVGHQQFGLAVVHRQRPERVGRGQGVFVEVQGVIVFRGIDRLPILVDEIADVIRFFGGVAENANVGAGIAVQVVALEVITGAEKVAAGEFVGIHFGFLEFGEFCLGTE